MELRVQQRWVVSAAEGPARFHWAISRVPRQTRRSPRRRLIGRGSFPKRAPSLILISALPSVKSGLGLSQTSFAYPFVPPRFVSMQSVRPGVTLCPLGVLIRLRRCSIRSCRLNRSWKRIRVVFPLMHM